MCHISYHCQCQHVTCPYSFLKINLSVADITAFATCAATGDGLSETLEWLDDQLAAKQAKHAVIKPLINAVPSSVARFSGSVSEAVKDTFAYMMAWFSAPSSNEGS